MNKKKLAISLSKLKQVSDFNIALEQYVTPGDFAADFLSLVDCSNKKVADLGCGNGVLGVGCLLLNAKFVYFLDKDLKSLEVCASNVKSFKNCELINSDVSKFNHKVDVVVMNPPFGVQNRKADKKFLEVAMKYSDEIYSMHKIESKGFISKLCSENGFKVVNIIEKEFEIRKTYKFHTKKKHSFKVGIWVLKRNI